ncbi:MAG: RNA 2',3'-cyclic phosphodiesterase [Planctomycetota bacterium]|jgi:2'-5' RNA ligase
MRRRPPARAADSVRAFLAIRVPLNSLPHDRPDSLQRDRLLTLLDEFHNMGTAVRAVAAESIHLTLKFFGDLRPIELQTARETVAPIAAATFPFDFHLQGIGAFPNERRPAVIWVGAKDSEPCVLLAEELELALSEAGFPMDSKSFKPHVTLARVKARPPERLGALLKKNANQDFGSFPVERLELIGSELTPSGPVYSTLTEFELTSP